MLTQLDLESAVKGVLISAMWNGCLNTLISAEVTILIPVLQDLERKKMSFI